MNLEQEIDDNSVHYSEIKKEKQKRVILDRSYILMPLKERKETEEGVQLLPRVDFDDIREICKYLRLKLIGQDHPFKTALQVFNFTLYFYFSIRFSLISLPIMETIAC